jgi:hypothetical protein
MSAVMMMDISDLNPEALFADGFEDALVGYVEQFNKVLAAYSRERCVDILMKRDDMDWDEAEEFFTHNVLGSYVGENTPVFLTLL